MLITAIIIVIIWVRVGENNKKSHILACLHPMIGILIFFIF